ncbi:MAG: purine-nucleoside phosphorylase, partial [Bacteroidetes bacterium]|nr:purine-nucleoside phosphorylase [Bacteroidota bacterium]
MSDLITKIKETLKVIKEHTKDEYPVGIILGTGLGGLVKEINVEHEIDYSNLPHFPVSTVESHKGKLIFGTIGDKKVVAMQGRFHYYEGYSMQQITFPVRVMKFLGVKTLLVSNACGGLNPLFQRGDIMLMVDHINFL